MQIFIIAAVDMAGGIGRNGRLLCRICEDMERFKTLTAGRTVIMGRKTFEEIGRPLLCRTNIILSRTMQQTESIAVATSFEDALLMCNNDVFVIGGGETYRAAMPQAQRIYLTQIYVHFVADAFFPKIDAAQWQEVDRQHFDCGRDFPNPFDFILYERINLL